ncbi:MAG: hypothetical protein AAB726_01870 [Patescibacteria group bacterium]
MLRKITSEANQKTIVWALLAGIFFLSGLYVFLVHQTVFLVVEREATAEKFSALSTDIVSLQSEHLSLSNKITADLVYSLGYKEARPTFIPRQSVSTIARAGAL